MSAPTKPAKKTAKKTAAKKVAAGRPAAARPDADVVEQVIAATNVDVATFPVMGSLHQLPRRQRAEMVAAFSRLPDMDAVDRLMRAAAADNASLADQAALLTVMADVEDMLAAVAVEPDRFRMWAQTATEPDLIVLLSQVVADSGEAPSSSS